MDSYIDKQFDVLLGYICIAAKTPAGYNPEPVALSENKLKLIEKMGWSMDDLPSFIQKANYRVNLKKNTCEKHKNNCAKEIMLSILQSYNWMLLYSFLQSGFDKWLVYMVRASGNKCISKYFEWFDKYKYLDNLYLADPYVLPNYTSFMAPSENPIVQQEVNVVALDQDTYLVEIDRVTYTFVDDNPYALERESYKERLPRNFTLVKNSQGVIRPIKIEECHCNKCGEQPEKIESLEDWEKDLKKPRLFPLSQDGTCNKCLGMIDHSVFKEVLIDGVRANVDSTPLHIETLEEFFY